jgi:antitoxin HicB
MTIWAIAEEARVAHRDYPIVIEPLSKEDGGGFVAIVPDLPGCMSDGETREEAARNVADAIISWIDEATHSVGQFRNRRSISRSQVNRRAPSGTE